MKEEFDHIDDLIGKYLSNEASEKERLQVENWIEKDEANRSYFNHLQLIFERSRLVRTTQQFDADKAWAKLKSKISQPQGKVVSFTQYWTILKFAAVLIVGLGGYFVYQQFSTSDPGVVIASQNKVVRDTLPDGSFAVLNKSSSIQYAYNPNNSKRKVVLDGEAFFDVKHQEDKPFIIETGGVIIEDIGTSFNVYSLPESPTIEVYVESGEVAFYTLSNPGLNLTAGETGIYHKKSKSFARLLKTDTNRLAYKTGVFAFRNADLGTIIDDLNGVYDTKIRLANLALTNCRLNVSFRNEKIDDIVEIIAETLKLTISKEGDEYVLNGTSCGD